jgi:acyl-CoA thioester hydrolase
MSHMTEVSPMSLHDVRRTDFPQSQEVQTRWHDNDAYGHVNNVMYYSYFDTAVNRFLIESGALSIQTDQVVGYVRETSCSYFRPVAFPDALHVGLRVSRLGRSSVRYQLALFREEEVHPVAIGHFVHVYVDRRTGRSAPIPSATRQLLERILVSDVTTG